VKKIQVTSEKKSEFTPILGFSLQAFAQQSLVALTIRAPFLVFFITSNKDVQWQVYFFSSLFILDVANQSQKDHKLFSSTYIYVAKKFPMKS